MQPAPSKHAILLFSDVVGSTDLKSRFGTAAYARLLRRHNAMFEGRCKSFSGCEILKHTGDGYFATFATASDAVNFALGFQADMRAEHWEPAPLTTRIGIHAGEVAMMTMIGKADVIGLAADLAARVMSLAVGGQILMTRSVFDDARQFIEQHPDVVVEDQLKVRWMAHGPYRFKGSADTTDIFEVGAESVAPLRAPPDAEKARRVVPPAAVRHLGWRPARGQTVPNRPGWRLSNRLRSEQSEETWIGQNAQTGERRRFRFLFEDDGTGSIKDIFTIQKAVGDKNAEAILDSQLGEAPMFVASSDVPDDELTPKYIDRYRILEPLGEGGMGVVYRAEQVEPVRREVAIKLIKPGMDSNEVLARFEAERQALAIMSHPSIAKVLDAGVTERGRPYFVMEYVRGEKLTDYCDRQQLTTHQRLELFCQVCDGVQHAHSKGIIHRDIKPSNILVTIRDETAVPVIIDFGVAKATSQRLTERSLFTERGQLVGTPEYMSPEQAEMNNLDIDTRTDVYSLGVVLYELLVGALPFDPQSLRSAAYGEIQRIIREVDPPRLSTRLSGLGERALEIAKHRRSALGALASEMRGELEWIPLKAMRKDRTERYETVRDLSRDIDSYLTGRPLQAGPESVVYRLRKFVARNRGRVILAGSVGLLIVSTVATSFVLITRQRNMAIAAREQAEQSQRAARSAVVDFFNDVSQSEQLRFDALKPLRRQLLSRAKSYFEQFAREKRDDPSRREDLAWTLNALGDVARDFDSPQAAKLLGEALAIRQELAAASKGDMQRQINVASSFINLGNTFQDAADHATAIAGFDSAIKVLEPLSRTSIEAKSQLAQAHHNRAVALDAVGNLTGAITEHEKAAVIRRELVAAAPSELRYRSELASSLSAAAKLVDLADSKRALLLMSEATRLREQLLESQPESTQELRSLAEGLSWIVTLQQQTNDPTTSAAIDRADASWRKLLFSAEHFGPPTAAVEGFNNLTWLALLANRPQEAESFARRGLEISQEEFNLLANLAMALLAQSKNQEAEVAFKTAVKRMTEHGEARDYFMTDFETLKRAGTLSANQIEQATRWLD